MIINKENRPQKIYAYTNKELKWLFFSIVLIILSLSLIITALTEDSFLCINFHDSLIKYASVSFGICAILVTQVILRKKTIVTRVQPQKEEPSTIMRKK